MPSHGRDHWYVDETYVKVAGRWRYVYPGDRRVRPDHRRLRSARRDTRTARRFFTMALGVHGEPAEVVSDRSWALRAVIGELIPGAFHDTARHANNRIEADHGRLKERSARLLRLRRRHLRSSSRRSRIWRAGPDNLNGRQSAVLPGKVLAQRSRARRAGVGSLRCGGDLRLYTRPRCWLTIRDIDRRGSAAAEPGACGLGRSEAIIEALFSPCGPSHQRRPPTSPLAPDALARIDAVSTGAVIRSTLNWKETAMGSVARITEISATSEESFDHAIATGIERASGTLRNVKSAWVKEQQVKVQWRD